MVEGATLEKSCTAMCLGFESLALRQQCSQIYYLAAFLFNIHIRTLIFDTTRIGISVLILDSRRLMILISRLFVDF